MIVFDACIVCMLGVTWVRSGCELPWNWRCRLLWVTILVLRLEPRSFSRVPSAIDYWAIFQAPTLSYLHIIFNMSPISHTCFIYEQHHHFSYAHDLNTYMLSYIYNFVIFTAPKRQVLQNLETGIWVGGRSRIGRDTERTRPDCLRMNPFFQEENKHMVSLDHSWLELLIFVTKNIPTVS